MNTYGADRMITLNGALPLVQFYMPLPPWACYMSAHQASIAWYRKKGHVDSAAISASRHAESWGHTNIQLNCPYSVMLRRQAECLGEFKAIDNMHQHRYRSSSRLLLTWGHRQGRSLLDASWAVNAQSPSLSQ